MIPSLPSYIKHYNNHLIPCDVFFPASNNIDPEEFRVVIDISCVALLSFASLHLEVILGHVRSRHWQSMPRSLLKHRGIEVAKLYNSGVGVA